MSAFIDLKKTFYPILTFYLYVHKLVKKHLQFYAKLFAVYLAALSILTNESHPRVKSWLT